jgi:hypothetical protein
VAVDGARAHYVYGAALAPKRTTDLVKPTTQQQQKEQQIYKAVKYLRKTQVIILKDINHINLI